MVKKGLKKLVDKVKKLAKKKIIKGSCKCKCCG